MPDTNFVMERLEFMKLDRKAQDDIRRLKPVLDKQLPDALGKFYAHISGVPQVARFFTDAEHMARAKKNQIGHWLNIAAADFGDLAGKVGAAARQIGDLGGKVGAVAQPVVGGVVDGEAGQDRDGDDHRLLGAETDQKIKNRPGRGGDQHHAQNDENGSKPQHSEVPRPQGMIRPASQHCP